MNRSAYSRNAQERMAGYPSRVGTTRRDEYGNVRPGEYGRDGLPIGSSDPNSAEKRDAHWDKYFGGRKVGGTVAAPADAVNDAAAPALAAPQWPAATPQAAQSRIPVGTGTAAKPSNPRGAYRRPVQTGPGIARGKAQYSDAEIAGELARTKTMLQPGANGNDPTRPSYESKPMIPRFAGTGMAPLPPARTLATESASDIYLPAGGKTAAGIAAKYGTPAPVAAAPAPAMIPPAAAPLAPAALPMPATPVVAAPLPTAAAYQRGPTAHPIVTHNGAPARVVQSTPAMPPGAASYTAPGQAMVHGAMGRAFEKLGAGLSAEVNSPVARGVAAGKVAGGKGDAALDAATRQPSTFAGAYVNRAQKAAGSLADTMKGTGGEGSPLFNGLTRMAGALPNPELPMAFRRKSRPVTAPYKLAQGSSL